MDQTYLKTKFKMGENFFWFCSLFDKEIQNSNRTVKQKVRKERMCQLQKV